MATVNVGLLASGGPLLAGQEHHWFWDGLKDGQIRWFIAHANNNPGIEHRLEITRTFTLMKVDGSRQMNFVVRNIGSSDFTYYKIYYAATS